MNLIHNPEFLTARCAFNDFHSQYHIVLGKTKENQGPLFDELVKLYSKFYTPNISITDSTSSESMKIFANCFYSTKKRCERKLN